MNLTNVSRFFSALSDTLTFMCIYYLVAAYMIVRPANWGIGIVWLVLPVVVFTVMWMLLLRKPKAGMLIVFVTAICFAATTAFYIWISSTEMSFRYLLMIAVGPGIAVGLSFYYSLHCISIQKHLMVLDYMVICTAAFFLLKNALVLDPICSIIMVLVLILDICSAVFLRLSEDDTVNSADAAKAIRLTICCAGIPVFITAILSAIFSKSGNIFSKVFTSLASFIIVIWKAIENGLKWLFSHFDSSKSYDVIEIEELPSISDIENEIIQGSLNINTRVIGIVLCIILLVVLILAVLILRKRQISNMQLSSEKSASGLTRNNIYQINWWGKLKEQINFEIGYIKNRNTAAGLFIYLERVGKRRRKARLKAETMRSYISRIDAENKLSRLSDALDEQYYSNNCVAITTSDCKVLRQYIKTIVK